MGRTSPSSLLGQLSRRIDGLSPAHRKVAKHVLGHPFRAATMGIEELAAAAGVSVATVTRFARAAGFAGYPEFRGRLLSEFEKTIAPVEKLRTSQMAPGSGVAPILRDSLRKAAGNLDHAGSLLGEEPSARAVELILQARRVVMLGFGVGAVTGRLIADLFMPYCAAVEVLDGTGGPERMIRHAMRFGPADLVIAITVPRYSRATVELLREARRRGARILGLTDAPSSPIVPECDVALFAPADHPVLHSSVVALVALAEGLAAVLACRRDTVLEAADLTERLLPFLLIEEDTSAPASEPAEPRIR